MLWQYSNLLGFIWLLCKKKKKKKKNLQSEQALLTLEFTNFKLSEIFMHQYSYFIFIVEAVLISY